jgi:NAD(P)-dependent dehydrogenase (short-subunit alcohol dehydrogenase family)
MGDSKVALVTGASRGIGKASALKLAAAGFDVAITARTEKEGQGKTEANSVRGDDPIVAIPGSLETTAKEIEALGQRALSVRMDLLDPDAVVAAPKAVLAEWGRIDVLFNNAIFQGGATMDRILDLTPEAMLRLCEGNYVHQVLLTQQVVPHMLERGSGRVINMVSGSARLDPIGPAGEGGWGIGYSASKAAFGRVAGGINAEFGPKGILAFNVDPGNVITEKRKALRPEDDFEGNFGSESPEATGAAVAWLASSDDATRFLGKWIYAPKLTEDLGLLA